MSFPKELRVAMTRAKDDLHLMVPQRFFTHASICKVTVTSTPHGRVSSRTGFSTCSRRQPGQLLSWCRGADPRSRSAHRRGRTHARDMAVGVYEVCNLYSMTTNVNPSGACSRSTRPTTGSGNLPPMPGIYPDYPAPIVRTGSGRELAMARWGMPSSQKALLDATKKRAEDSRFQGSAPVGARQRDHQYPQRREHPLKALVRTGKLLSRAVHFVFGVRHDRRQENSGLVRLR